MAGQNFDSGVCFIDKNFRILYVNQEFSRMYPDAAVGHLCYQDLSGVDCPCAHCPLKNSKEDTEQLFFHARLQTWITARFFQMEFPGHGDCYGVTMQPARSTDVISQTVQVMNREHPQSASSLWKTTLNGMPNGYYRCEDTEQLPFAYISQRFCEMMGYSEEEIREQFGNSIVNMIHPDDLEIVWNFAKDVRETNTYQQTVYRIQSRSGYIWVLNATKYVSFGGKNYFQSNTADVSEFIQEQLHREQSLQIANWKKDQYKKAIISGADAVYEINVTRDLLENITTTQEELKSFYNSILQELPCSYSAYLQRATAFLKPENTDLFLKQNDPAAYMENFRQGKLEWQIEYDTNASGKEYRHMRKNYFLTQDPQTDDVYVLVVSKDITQEALEKRKQELELKKQKEALSRSLSQAEKTLQVIGGLCKEYEAAFYVDPARDICIPYVLPEKYSRLIYQELCFSQHADAYVHSEVMLEDQPTMSCITVSPAVQAALQASGSYQIQYRILNNGKPEHYQLRIVQLSNSNEQVWAYRSVEALVQEERKKQEELQSALEKAQKAEAVKSAFLFNMSHDIRTPMNAIIGFTGLAEKHIREPEKAMDALRKTDLSSRHLLSIIDDVLEMAQIESGQVKLNDQVVDVPEYFRQVTDMFSSAMADKQIHFVTKSDFITPYVHIDGTRVTQVISNLLNNALKFTHAGGTVSYISREMKKTADGFVEYEVRIQDTGIGMSPEFQQKLYDVFAREKNAANSGLPGTGLGLAISKNLTDMLGGTLECRSEQGKGTEFIFRFRAKIATKGEELLVSLEKTDHVSADFSGYRVLLAEDNDLNLEIATEILLEYGFSVETAENGAVALAKVEQSRPGYYDLVLMDVQMPVMDGYTAARAIRRLPDPALASIPVVAITDNAPDSDRQQAEQAGMNGHLAKPIHVPDMIALFRSLLGK